MTDPINAKRQDIRELVAADERFRTKWTSTSKSFDAQLQPHMAYVEDLSIAADDWLWLRDPTPLSEMHLLTLGYRPKDDGILQSPTVVESMNTHFRWLTVWLGGIEWNWAYHHLGPGGEDHCRVPAPPTVGAYRQLCVALHLPTENRP